MRNKTKPNNRKKKPDPLLARIFANPNGRPAKHTEESLETESLKYFKICSAQMFPTKAGICLWLGIARDTYNEYRKKFPATIKAIDLKIENTWVQRLTKQGATGAIFYLKNAFKEEYKDRTDHDLTTGGQPITGMRIIKDK